MTIDQTQLKNLGSKNNKAYLSANAYFKARGADAVPYLVEQAEAEKANDDPLTRQRIAMLLGHIGDPRGFATLEGLASDPLEETRYDAVVALGNLRDPRCLPLLLDIFQRGDDQEYVVPTLACYLLARQGDEAISMLAEMLPRSSRAIRLSIIDALGKAGNPVAASVLVPLLSDSEAEVRMAALEAIGMIPLENACHYLSLHCDDPDEGVRSVAHYWRRDLQCECLY